MDSWDSYTEVKADESITPERNGGGIAVQYVILAKRPESDRALWAGDELTPPPPHGLLLSKAGLCWKPEVGSWFRGFGGDREGSSGDGAGVNCRGKG